MTGSREAYSVRFSSRQSKWSFAFFQAAALFSVAMALSVAFSDSSLGYKVPFFLYAAAIALMAQNYAAGTEYIIGGGDLTIKTGFLWRRSIPLAGILRVRPIESRKPSGTLLRKKFRIYFTQTDYLEVSPERDEEFLAKLKEAAPHIAVEPTLTTLARRQRVG